VTREAWDDAVHAVPLRPGGFTLTHPSSSAGHAGRSVRMAPSTVLPDWSRKALPIGAPAVNILRVAGQGHGQAQNLLHPQKGRDEIPPTPATARPSTAGPGDGFRFDT
jgi:hypothetical protein